MPAGSITRAIPPEFGDYYGTTLRVYDPGLDAWHILWSDPLTQTYQRQLGRARGNDIVQEGRDDASGALELHRHHGRFIPLAGRGLARRRFVDSARRLPSAPHQPLNDR